MEKLGLQRSHEVIVCALLMRLTEPHIALDDFSNTLLLRHLIATGLCSSILAQDTGYANAMDAFNASVLHDIGIAILLHADTKPFYTHVLTERYRNACDLHTTENAYLGITHEEVGMLAGRHWLLPAKVVEVLRRRHLSVQNSFLMFL